MFVRKIADFRLEKAEPCPGIADLGPIIAAGKKCILAIII
jgi:hypothetical protein